MTRAQAIKAARARAGTLRIPVTVVHDFASGDYAALPGDLSIAQIRAANPAYERVVVISPASVAA